MILGCKRVKDGFAVLLLSDIQAIKIMVFYSLSYNEAVIPYGLPCRKTDNYVSF